MKGLDKDTRECTAQTSKPLEAADAKRALTKEKDLQAVGRIRNMLQDSAQYKRKSDRKNPVKDYATESTIDTGPQYVPGLSKARKPTRAGP